MSAVSGSIPKIAIPPTMHGEGLESGNVSAKNTKIIRTYADLITREKYRSGVVIRGKTKINPRRAFLAMVRFLTSCLGSRGHVSSTCAMDALGTPRRTVVICSRASVQSIAPIEALFPQCDFVWIVGGTGSGVRADGGVAGGGTRSVNTTPCKNGMESKSGKKGKNNKSAPVCGISSRGVVTRDDFTVELAREMGERYPDCIWCAGEVTIADETARMAEFAWQRAVLTELAPRWAMLPFRHSFGGGETLRWHGELHITPWAPPHYTVLMLYYREGTIMAPCETSKDYEEKLFYFNQRMRGGRISVEQEMERDIWAGFVAAGLGRADVFTDSVTKCVEWCDKRFPTRADN